MSPVGRHRNTGEVRLGRWLAALATATVVVVLGGAVTNSELSVDERFREFAIPGEVGDWVSTDTFDVSVVAVRTAAVISTGSGLDHDTAGVWVLVRVRAMADQEAMWLGYAAVRDSAGQLWLATDRIDQPLVDSGYRLDPRIPVEAEVAFEVPAEAATDLTLRLGKRPGIYALQMATLVEFPLPVDAAMVASGIAEPESEPEPVVIEYYPQVVIADPQILVGDGGAGR
jgi:hypothetical protein